LKKVFRQIFWVSGTQRVYVNYLLSIYALESVFPSGMCLKPLIYSNKYIHMR